jgi:geranylgeranyl pyrophosphate synthase
MSESFLAYLGSCQRRAEQALQRCTQSRSSPYSIHDSGNLTARLDDAVRYSLLNGGKRVRPTLVYASAAAIGHTNNDEALDTIAASIECLHCYSLVHDDLPAMDDDDLRRGQATCHKAFDEATAILSGDALQSLAFELLADCPQMGSDQRMALVKILASAAGSRGMVGGQFIDLSLEQHPPALDLLETMHSLKTGALIRAAIAMGGIAANATTSQLAALDEYGRHIGLAFQVKDDLLDIEGNTAVLGKRQGSDLDNSKMTYPALLGIHGSREKLAQLLQLALQALAPFGESARALQQLAEYIVNRDY